MERVFWVLGSVFGLVSVAAGAFGAHALRGRVGPELLAVFETAARYQMYHALALLLAARMVASARGAGVEVAGWAFVVGIILFSGSLYVLSLTGVRWLGAITPLGGVAFLIGWIALAWAGAGEL
jgi:uncharacterized membrane protein YgdD (TMEM256/DUF423 family)